MKLDFSMGYLKSIYSEISQIHYKKEKREILNEFCHKVMA